MAGERPAARLGPSSRAAGSRSGRAGLTAVAPAPTPRGARQPPVHTAATHRLSVLVPVCTGREGRQLGRLSPRVREVRRQRGAVGAGPALGAAAGQLALRLQDGAQRGRRGAGAGLRGTSAQGQGFWGCSSRHPGPASMGAHVRQGGGSSGRGGGRSCSGRRAENRGQRAPSGAQRAAQRRARSRALWQRGWVCAHVRLPRRAHLRRLEGA